MMKYRLLSLDFIFLYISLILIGWMVGSNILDKRIDNSYAETIKVRAGYEIRDYTSGIFIGNKISFDSLLWWREIEEVKKEIQDKGIQIIEYPYFIRLNQDGSREVFFNIVKGSQVESFEGFSVAFPATNTAFSEFTWYPTKNAIRKTQQRIESGLMEDDITFDSDTVWVEVRNHHITIPFMMSNGVFIDLE